MRIANLALLICVATGAFITFGFIDAIYNALFMWQILGPGAGDVSSVTMLAYILPQLLIGFLVLIASGSMLFRVVDSTVPLKWCLGLGSLIGFICLLIGVVARPNNSRGNSYFLDPLIISIFSICLAIAPAIGGFRAKQARSRKRS